MIGVARFVFEQGPCVVAAEVGKVIEICAAVPVECRGTIVGSIPYPSRIVVSHDVVVVGLGATVRPHKPYLIAHPVGYYETLRQARLPDGIPVA